MYREMRFIYSITIFLYSLFFTYTLNAPDIDFVFSKSFKGYRYIGEFKITAYESSEKSCGIWADGRTALNLRVAKGICAVDPDIIPLGSIIYIKEIGYFIAVDTGKSIKGRMIDIFLPTIKECQEFGIKYRRVYTVKF